MIKNLLLKYILPIFIFILIVFSISYKVLPSTWVIAYNDWSYFFNIDVKKDYQKSVYTDDYLWQDLSGIVFLNFWKTHIISGMKSLWFNDNYISYIITFWLAFLCSIIYYFIFLKISWNILVGYLSWFFVLFNNFTIESIAFGWYFYYFLWLISLWWLLLLLYNIYNNEKLIFKDIILISLLSIIIILPIHLVMYILIIIFIYIFSLIKGNVIKNNYLLPISILLIILLHWYWILPFLINMFTVSSDVIYWWNADAVLNGYSKIANYLNIMSFRQYFNLISFKIFPFTFVYIWYFILLAFIVYILFIKKIFSKKEYSLLLFLTVLYFVFFNISLGPNSFLTGGIYQYLWDNFSFFHFFRSFTRFIIVIIPLFLLIFTIFFKVKILKKRIFVLVISALVIFHFPLMSWNLNGVVTSMNVPNEYNELNEIINKKDRIISFPNISYETYSWSINESDLMIQDYYFNEYMLNSPIIYNRASLLLHNRKGIFKTLFLPDFKWPKLFNTVRDNNIKYIIIHKDNINVFNWKIIYYKDFIKYFNRYWNKVIENKYYNLYSIDKIKPKIYLNDGNLTFKQISSVKYKINIKNINNNTLYFLNNFSDKWKIYPLSDDGNNLKAYSYSDIKLFFSKTLFWWDNHKKYNKYANKWDIDKEFIINNYNPNIYTVNNDWSINLNVILFYKPQIYLYIWFIITLITFILLSSSFLVYKIRILKFNKKLWKK